MPEDYNQQKIDLSAKKIVAGWPKVGYDQSDDEVLGFYARASGTTKNRHSMFYGKRLADIFIYSMALGKHANIGQPYDKKSDRKDSIDFEYIANQPEYLWMMIAVAVEDAEKNGEDPLKIFENPREKIIDVCERYANYGVRLLMKMENAAATADPLIGYEEKIRELLDENKI